MMGATLWFELFVLCYHLLAVDGLAHKVNTGDVHVQKETGWQQGQGDIRKMESLLVLKQQWPAVGLKRRLEPKFSLDRGLSNTKEDSQNTLQIDTTELNTITTNSEDCQLLPRLRTRGGKEGQAPPLRPNLMCPVPSTGSPQSGQQQQPPTTGNGGDEPVEGPASSGKKQEQPFILPNLLRIPINDGNNPICYDATYGLMPIGVCQNPQRNPQPSRYDVFMNRNIDIYPRAWKLIDSQPGASSLFSHQFDPTQVSSIPLAP